MIDLPNYQKLTKEISFKVDKDSYKEENRITIKNNQKASVPMTGSHRSPRTGAVQKAPHPLLLRWPPRRHRRPDKSSLWLYRRPAAAPAGGTDTDQNKKAVLYFFGELSGKFFNSACNGAAYGLFLL